jgi:hypothetical protein
VDKADDKRQERSDPTGMRQHRVTVLRDLIAHRAYDVPGDAVAASILRDSLVIPVPARERRH